MFLLIGLDPVRERLPKFFLKKEYPFFEFCKAIVDATFDFPIIGYKPNSAFFEAEGDFGIKQLKMTVDYIKEKHKALGGKKFILLDAKRGDIGSTNLGYLKYAFEYLGVDGITLHPYLGKESLNDFLKYSKENNKILFILCKTSNPGAEEFQNLELKEGLRLYEKVALQVKNEWSKIGNCGLVVGATYPDDLERVRKLVGKDIPILAPGVGFQGGDLGKTLRAGGYYQGAKLFIPISRAIIYPELENEEFLEFERKVRTRTKAFLKANF